MAGNASFGVLASTTLQKYRLRLADHLRNHHVLWWQLDQRGFITEEDGGTSIVEPILYGLNSTARFYAGYDLLDVTPQEGITAAEFAWKQAAVAVSMSGIESFKNQGQTRVLKLLTARITQADTSLRRILNKSLIQGDGTGAVTGYGANELTGFGVAVEDGTAWSTYGGIDSSDAANSWWRNAWLDFTGAGNTSFITAAGGSKEGIKVMTNMYNTLMRGNDGPTLILTTQDLYEAYENTADEKQRFTNTKLADLGFTNQTFKGVPMVFDADVPANTMFFLNANHLKFTMGSGMNFTPTPMTRAPQQDADRSHILVYGNVTTDERRAQGRISNFVSGL